MSELKRTVAKQNEFAEKSFFEIVEDNLKNGVFKSDWDNLPPLRGLKFRFKYLG